MTRTTVAMRKTPEASDLDRIALSKDFDESVGDDPRGGETKTQRVLRLAGFGAQALTKLVAQFLVMVSAMARLLPS